MDLIVWHDVECGGYAADLPLWRTLAAQADGPVLDLGAGTGRVALDLAQHGHQVHALDVEPELLGELERRAGRLDVTTHALDARAFDLGHQRFALVIAPMQTVQLLGGADGRASCLRSVRRHLQPGGLFAAALANAVEGFEGGEVEVAPDMREVGGTIYASRPTAIHSDGGAFVLERVREKVAPDGTRTVSDDRIQLDRVGAGRLAQEARELGFTPEPPLHVSETPDHVGSEVVMLRA